MPHYTSIEILTEEDDRCVIPRGIAGCDKNGAVATTRVEVLSSLPPIRITIIPPAPNLEQVTHGFDQRVSRGTSGSIACRLSMIRAVFRT